MPKSTPRPEILDPQKTPPRYPENTEQNTPKYQKCPFWAFFSVFEGYCFRVPGFQPGGYFLGIFRGNSGSGHLGSPLHVRLCSEFCSGLIMGLRCWCAARDGRIKGIYWQQGIYGGNHAESDGGCCKQPLPRGAPCAKKLPQTENNIWGRKKHDKIPHNFLRSPPGSFATFSRCLENFPSNRAEKLEKRTKSLEKMQKGRRRGEVVDYCRLSWSNVSWPITRRTWREAMSDHAKLGLGGSTSSLGTLCCSGKDCNIWLWKKIQLVLAWIGISLREVRNLEDLPGRLKAFRGRFVSLYKTSCGEKLFLFRFRCFGAILQACKAKSHLNVKNYLARWWELALERVFWEGVQRQPLPPTWSCSEIPSPTMV